MGRNCYGPKCPVTWPFIRLFNGPLVSPTYCLLQLLQEIRYTTFSVVQSVFCLSLTVAPEDDLTVPAEVIILQHGHRDNWRHRRFEKSPTAEHFHSADHDFLSNASVCCLEHNKEWSDSTRKLRESYWIRRLNTLCPFGINKGD